MVELGCLSPWRGRCARLVNRPWTGRAYRCRVPRSHSSRASVARVESPAQATLSVRVRRDATTGLLDRDAFLEALRAALCASLIDSAAFGPCGPPRDRRVSAMVLCWVWEADAGQPPSLTHCALAGTVLSTWADEVSGALASRWSASGIALYVPVGGAAAETLQAVQAMLDATSAALGGLGRWVARLPVELHSGEAASVASQLQRLRQAFS